MPYSAHRKKYLLSENIYSLDKIDLVKEPEVVYQSKTNSKNNRSIELYVNGDRGRAGIKGSYLLRPLRLSAQTQDYTKHLLQFFMMILMNQNQEAQEIQ